MKRNKIWELICMILFMLGLFIFYYPNIREHYVNQKMEDTAQEFLERVTEPSESPTEESAEPFIPEEEATKSTEFVPSRYEDLWNDMTKYNQKIWSQRQTGLCDPWSYKDPSFCLADYGMEEEVFGVLMIPRLELKMPVYLGATWQHMADGAAQLSQTSLPIGGENTNCVIAGHRGWRCYSYFKYLDRLETGDEVILQNPWQELRYRVKEIQIIDPDDVEAVRIRKGEDLLTLLTCHPYASGGKQRYLVICERANLSEREEIQQ